MTDHHATADGCLANAHCEMAELLHAVLARFGNQPAPPAAGVDRSHISDGYHAFAELYDHRHSLMLALMRAIPTISSRGGAGNDVLIGHSGVSCAGELDTLQGGLGADVLILDLASLLDGALSKGEASLGITDAELEELFRAWWAESYPTPPGPHALMTHIGWARHLLDQAGVQQQQPEQPR